MKGNDNRRHKKQQTRLAQKQFAPNLQSRTLRKIKSAIESAVTY